MSSIHKLIRLLRNDPRPVRRLASRLLLHLPFDAARLIRLRVRDYQIYLHRSSLAAEFWYDSNARRDDYDFLTFYLKDTDVYIDVGANIGTTVIPAAMRVPRGRVVALEPHPRIFTFLQENLRLNGLTNVDARNSAAGAEHGELFFTDEPADDRNHPSSHRGRLRVAVEPLDHVTRDIERIALIKIDVEGYEKHVLDGGPQTLAKTDCVYFELCESHAQRFGHGSRELLDRFHEHGFHLFRRVDRDRLEPLTLDYGQSVRKENAFAIRDLAAFLERTGWRA